MPIAMADDRFVYCTLNANSRRVYNQAPEVRKPPPNLPDVDPASEDMGGGTEVRDETVW